MTGFGERETAKKGAGEGPQTSLRLKGKRFDEALRALPSHPIPVRPNTRFEAYVRLRGDARIQFAEYDESGELIGRQWTQAFYFEESRRAIYTVKTTEWTRWIVVQIDNPGSEETTVEHIELWHGEIALTAPSQGGAQ